jgi:hypothetical protein
MDEEGKPQGRNRTIVGLGGVDGELKSYRKGEV